VVQGGGRHRQLGRTVVRRLHRPGTDNVDDPDYADNTDHPHNAEYADGYSEK
jgi:hypothetical protein